MDQPSIYIGNLLLEEPITVLTDVAVSLICFYAFLRLKNHNYKNANQHLFSYYFLFTGIGTFIAAFLGHGFLYYFGHIGKLPGWIFSMIGISIFELVSVRISTKKIQFLEEIIITKLILFLLLVFWYQHFSTVQIFSALGILGIITPIHLWLYFKERKEYSFWILLGILMLVFAVLFFATKTSISPWFNHNDIGHIFMGLAAYLHYKGGILMKE